MSARRAPESFTDAEPARAPTSGDEACPRPQRGVPRLALHEDGPRTGSSERSHGPAGALPAESHPPGSPVAPGRDGAPRSDAEPSTHKG
jgi:hypothetical protein